MTSPKKYKHISFRPSLTVAREAKKGLELHRKFKRGGTRVGLARARDLKNRRNLSPRTIKRMLSYFARHSVDKKGRNFYNPTKPSNGYIAWLLWGGDPGASWALKIKKEMEKADRVRDVR